MPQNLLALHGSTHKVTLRHRPGDGIDRRKEGR